MKMLGRSIFVLSVAIGTYVVLLWPFPILFGAVFSGDYQFLDDAGEFTSFACALVAGCFTWRKLGSSSKTSPPSSSKTSAPITTAPLGLPWCLFLSAMPIGGASFVVGFPVIGILHPDNNLAALYVILYIGPGGVLFGAVVGLCYWAFQRQAVQASYAGTEIILAADDSPGFDPLRGGE